MNSENWGVSPP